MQRNKCIGVLSCVCVNTKCKRVVSSVYKTWRAITVRRDINTLNRIYYTIQNI